MFSQYKKNCGNLIGVISLRKICYGRFKQFIRRFGDKQVGHSIKDYSAMWIRHRSARSSTVCPRSLHPFYLVTKYNGSSLLGHTVDGWDLVSLPPISVTTCQQ